MTSPVSCMMLTITSTGSQGRTICQVSSSFIKRMIFGEPVFSEGEFHLFTDFFNTHGKNVTTTVQARIRYIIDHMGYSTEIKYSKEDYAVIVAKEKALPIVQDADRCEFNKRSRKISVGQSQFVLGWMPLVL